MSNTPVGPRCSQVNEESRAAADLNCLSFPSQSRTSCRLWGFLPSLFLHLLFFSQNFMMNVCEVRAAQRSERQQQVSRGRGHGDCGPGCSGGGLTADCGRAAGGKPRRAGSPPRAPSHRRVPGDRCASGNRTRGDRQADKPHLQAPVVSRHGQAQPSSTMYVT